MDLFEALLLLEEKQERENFIAKFGEDTYNLFMKSKDRLKNNKLSTDITWHIKHTSPEEMDNMLSSLQQKMGNSDKSEVDFSQKQIPGKYKYFGRVGNYDVYQPLDAESSMALGVNTGWCTTGRFGHYGDPNFKPSIKDAEKHFNDYTSKGIKFYYLLDPKTHYGEIAIAKYPDATLDVNKTIETSNEISRLNTTNFEIFNAKDKNDYSQISDLPKGFLDKFGLEVDYEVLIDKASMPTIDKKDIKGITLLSTEEASELSRWIRSNGYSWWLRSPGLGFGSSNAAYVNRLGSVPNHGYFVSTSYAAVRPALICDNLEPLNLETGDYVTALGKTWQYIGNDMVLLYGEPLTRMAFRKDWQAPDANDYEKSDIKKYLDTWFKE